MIYSDGVGLGFSSLQAAQDAAFSVNDIAFTRSSNSVSDVINGVTFDLAADAEGKSATLTVDSDLSEARSTVEDFISEFNEVTSYIQSKSAVTKIAEQEYKRGPLADASIFSNLRSGLIQDFMSSVSNDGQYENLREIGLTINDSLQATISDSGLFQEALRENFTDVGHLLDSVMGEIDNRLSRFTGTGGYMSSAIDSLGTQMSELGSDIDNLEERLEDKEEYLYNKYAEIQSQLASMRYSQQTWSSISSSMNRFI